LNSTLTGINDIANSAIKKYVPEEIQGHVQELKDVGLNGLRKTFDP